MKLSRFGAALILLLCLLLCVTACGKKKPATTTPSVTTTPAATPTTPPSVTPPATTEPTVMVDIVKGGATAYKIIQPARPAFAGPSSLAYSVYQAASRLGASMPIMTDKVAENAYEIIIGDTTRPETAQIVSRLDGLTNASSFYYLVAEVDGQLLLYATDTVAYGFLETYFVSTYVKTDGISIPEGLFDLQSMTWEAYAEYLAELDRIEQERLEQERLAKIELLKSQLKSFDASAFGDQPGAIKQAFSTPNYTPEAGSHPRIWVTEETLPTVRENLTGPANKAAYNTYMDLSETECDGILPAPSKNTYNMDYPTLAVIEAKAFRYLMTGDELYGYEAIYAIQNYMKTVVITSDISDNCRAYGYVMFITGCVYDWCYDLLTEKDKDQIIAGAVNLFCVNMEVGFPPSKQGGVTGHGAEAQVLRDYLALAIAIADERPDFYNYVCGRIQDVHVAATDYFTVSGSHWQGSAYGAHRYHFLLVSETLAQSMSGGEYSFYNETVGLPAYALLHYERPDGQVLRIGDCGTTTISINYGYNALLSGWLYDDSTLVANAYDLTSNFTKFGTSGVTVTAPMFLALNKPALMENMSNKLDLVYYCGSPLGSIIARSAWDDKDAVLVYMKIGESYSANHEHKDAGNFQIYYKGILAMKSGVYDTYVNEHGAGYYRQTISNNCLLVYNDNLSSVGNWIYSGGQSIHKPNVNGENATLEKWMEKSTIAQARIIGNDYLVSTDASGNDEYIFSYLAGDLTNAYDAETVEEYSRYMLSVMTDDPDNPMIFVVYDRVTSVDASYKKTFLLHVPEDPVIDDLTNTAIVTNTKRVGSTNVYNSGKLFVQSLLDDVTYSEIGGEGKYFWVNDRNIELYSSDPDKKGSMPADTSLTEYGWGRIEITPTEQNKTDRFLTVMYVTDAGNTAAQTPASEIRGETLVGAVLFGKAMLFPVNAETCRTVVSFTAPGSESLEYYVAGMNEGQWKISVNGSDCGSATVKKDGILRFTAPAGEVTLTPDYSELRYELAGGEAGETELPSIYNHGIELVLPTDPVLLGYEFVGWYTDPSDPDGSMLTSISASMRGEITLYARWKHVFDAIRYHGIEGATVNGEIPDRRLENETVVLPTDVVKPGYYFLGWFLDSSLDPESHVKVIDSSVPAGHVNLYAAWSIGFADEKFNSGKINLNSGTADTKINSLSYVVNGIPGSSFETVTDSATGNGYLKWTAGKDASSINLLADLAQTLKNANTSSFTVVVDLATLDGTAVLGATMRLRGVGAAGAGESTPIFHIGEDGRVYLGQGTETLLATLDGSFTEIAVTVDFATGTLIGYADGTKIATVSFSTPATSAVKGDTAAWLETLSTYVFNWFGRESATANRVLNIDNLRCYAGVFVAQ